ncbi:NlpC/P60 family protein [Jeotgalibacillus proteolyticus]|uniref:Glycoside hydrolase n=1 Tax=Jeotgalibacillus proteolyticus TaxID=2082395 RepID=A0A2S5GC21_9BACL|nr:NlpC/P60 family protein [Jeotgalibacillus proteolyticus]PPA70443.1 glycoside hydrolase [Jeotgalibacillus proteolyticus]
MKRAGVIMTILTVSLFAGFASQAEGITNAEGVRSSDAPMEDQAAPSQIIYTVKSGDTLYSIATNHSMTVDKLMEVNQLSGTLILPGQELAVSGELTTPAPAAAPASETPATSVSVQTVITIAKEQMGIPYVWGGSTPDGFDCSGFIYYVFKQAGLPFGRTTAEGQHALTANVSSPQAGDLVFFENTYKVGISHVGIYLGNNQFIHTNDGEGVHITDLDNAYWQEKFAGFGRFTN